MTITLVEGEDVAEECRAHIQQAAKQEPITLEVYGDNISRRGKLKVIAIASRTEAFVFDLTEDVGRSALLDHDGALRAILSDKAIRKSIYDCRNPADALQHSIVGEDHSGTPFEGLSWNVVLQGVLDLQILDLLVRNSSEVYETVREGVTLVNFDSCVQEVWRGSRFFLPAVDVGLMAHGWERLLEIIAARLWSLQELHRKHTTDISHTTRERWIAGSRNFLEIHRHRKERTYDRYEENSYLPYAAIPAVLYSGEVEQFSRGNLLVCVGCRRQLPESGSQRSKTWDPKMVASGRQVCPVCRFFIKPLLDREANTNTAIAHLR